jgi:hypothetical protein
MSDEATQAALRQMAGQIGELASSVRSLETNWRGQDEKASNGRAVLHTKIDDLGRDFHTWSGKLETVINDVAVMKPTVDEVRTVLRGKIESVILDVAEMKPTIDEVKAAKQRAIGAFMASRALYAVGMFLTAGVTWIAANWIKISIK